MFSSDLIFQNFENVFLLTDNALSWCSTNGETVIHQIKDSRVISN